MWPPDRNFAYNSDMWKDILSKNYPIVIQFLEEDKNFLHFCWDFIDDSDLKMGPIFEKMTSLIWTILCQIFQKNQPYGKKIWANLYIRIFSKTFDFYFFFEKAPLKNFCLLDKVIKLYQCKSENFGE